MFFVFFSSLALGITGPLDKVADGLWRNKVPPIAVFSKEHDRGLDYASRLHAFDPLRLEGYQSITSDKLGNNGNISRCWWHASAGGEDYSYAIVEHSYVNALYRSLIVLQDWKQLEAHSFANGVFQQFDAGYKKAFKQLEPSSPFVEPYEQALDPSSIFISAPKAVSSALKSQSGQNSITLDELQKIVREGQKVPSDTTHVIIPWKRSYSSSETDKCPGLVRVFDFENETKIPDNFTIRSSHGKSKIVIKGEKIVTIGNNFLSNCRNLTGIDLSSLRNVTQIGNNFLNYDRFDGYSELTTLDLGPLSNVTQIGDRFLAGCERLMTLDLGPLSNVTQIGDRFLAGCERLMTLDLGPLSNVTQIGGSFLSGCRGLTTLDLGPLSKVIQVKEFFLDDCSGLTTLDLGPLSKVTQVKEFFLNDCSGLTTLDLGPLSNVTQIWERFLSGCSGLTTLDLSPLKSVTQIGDSFLSDCVSLTSLDLSPFSNVTSVGKDFLSGTTTLIRVPNQTMKRLIQAKNQGIPEDRFAITPSAPVTA